MISEFEKKIKKREGGWVARFFRLGQDFEAAHVVIVRYGGVIFCKDFRIFLGGAVGPLNRIFLAAFGNCPEFKNAYLGG